MNLIFNAMENWRVELTADGQIVANVKIQSAIFQRHSLSVDPWSNDVTQLRILEIYSKVGSTNFKRSQENVNHLIYQDNRKVFKKYEKRIRGSVPNRI